ncbi:M20 family metallo-hydrolase [Paenibacillaceae bacterium WGS1546]|uniref:M20 family metallo-hydrolase n=1 Tax=Cohnella sp. WGS1546 TaxID=3366810 RepID=UPI00372D6118
MEPTAVNGARVYERLGQLAAIGSLGESGGVCRLALTVNDRRAVELVRGWMEEAGMTTRLDAFGNLIGRLEGEQPDMPAIMLGSHIDTQPYAGRYDGTVGVIGAIEVAATLREKGQVLPVALEVAAFCDEEGTRFNKGLFGSRGLVGLLEEGELERTDRDGVTRREALVAFGGDPARFAESQYAPGKLAAYLEMHIEQGPVLQALDCPVGIVTGISGPLWLTLELFGYAGHAGSVPMNMRRDAMVGAAKVVTAVHGLAARDLTTPSVATVGTLDVFPDSRNIIPEKVRMTIDLRDIDLERRRAMERELYDSIESICREHGLTYTIREDTNSEPRYCDPTIMSTIAEAAAEFCGSAPQLMSGPFHDALALSHYCKYGMIFVRCRDGISHNPQEYASREDIQCGTELLYRTVLKLSGTMG